MPVLLLERIPLPSLRTYTIATTLLLACSFYYAYQVANYEETLNDIITASSVLIEQDNTLSDHNKLFLKMRIALFEEAWCIWTLINGVYCILILFGIIIQRIVFGELRVSEQSHLKDKFWNFVFYKFIFIFGVMNVQRMEEVVVWCAWFSALGFLHLLCQLSKDRFEYLSFSPTTPARTHAKVLGLLIAIHLLNTCLFVVCFLVGLQAGGNTFAFMLAECVLLGIKTSYVIVRYAIHLWDLNHEGVWENRSIIAYYTEFLFEISTLSIEFAHHLHMLLWGNIFLSMASLVICMQLRYLFYEIQRRLRRHKNYLQVVLDMEQRFQVATKEDLEMNNDDCAICWDKMEAARKLPCGHLFHSSCLRSWLEQDTSCPTCRLSLSNPAEENETVDDSGLPTAQAGQPPPVNTTNHFFHFDGSRYVSWLPSFSVEVTHTQLLGNALQHQVIQTSQLDNMARQVQSVFSHMPLSTIIEDLNVTRSVEITIENILEGRLLAHSVIDAQRNVALSHDSSLSDEASNGDVHLTELSSDLSSHMQPSCSSSADTNFSMQSVPGARFSKCSSERESMLTNRKTSLLDDAKRKFSSKYGNAKEETLDESDDQTQSREHLAYHETNNDSNNDLRNRWEYSSHSVQRSDLS